MIHPPLSLVLTNRDEWTIPHVLELRASTHRDKTFIAEGESSRVAYTYGEMFELAKIVANQLLDRGFEPGDRLGIMLHNSLDFIVAWFGSALAGAVEVPINCDYSGGFLEHAVTLTTPRAIVVSPALAPQFIASRAALPGDLLFFVAGVGEEVSEAISALVATGWRAEPFELLKAGSSAAPSCVVVPRDLGAILSTSGTTGPSKGVMMPHAQLIFSALEVVCVMRLTEQDVLMLANPLFHGNAQFMTTLPALLTGSKLVLFDRFSASQFLTRVTEHRITVVNLLGAMMDWIWRQEPTPEDQDCPVRCIVSCPTPASIVDDFKARFGIEAVNEVFGQTEICLPFLTPYGVPRPGGAVGVAVEEFFDVQLVDPDTDEPVSTGEVGELVVRPKLPWILNSGYWGMPEASANARRNLWFHTGDGLKRDEDGWYYFTDRMKDTLRRRGENISSFEVEQVLLQHEAIAEAAVVAVPADFAGGEDEVKAVLVMKAEIAWEDLIEWARHRLPYFVVPRYWERVPELPKTPSSKIQKAQLRRLGVTPGTFDREAAGIVISRSRGR